MPDEAGFHLLCEGEVRSEGRVRCLFATDHSVYADQALELFLKLGPKGIEELTVFTAIEPTCRMVVANLHRHLADGIAGVQDAREVARQGTELAKSLEAQGIRSTARLRTGLVTHLIDAAMKETRSDLLILGARGYGAMEPRPIGSVASTIVHSATYPVLVVRV
jgi:nucleotide-binding universal stress UspA family protein